MGFRRPFGGAKQGRQVNDRNLDWHKTMKTVIIGNSGSGKTWLASELAKDLATPVVHLDDLFWEPGGFNKKRSLEEISTLVQESKLHAGWLVEGVFGDLATHYLEDADTLVWLDISWPVCEARLVRRGSESKQHMDRAQSEQGLKDLLAWASAYDSRTDLRSHVGHKMLFGAFPRAKFRLEDEASVLRFVKSAQQTTGANNFGVAQR